MHILEHEVNVFNRKTMPKDGETIADDINFDKLLPIMHSLSYYYRDPEACPFNHGNWILDIQFKDGDIYCFKYPKEMTRERFVEFIQPLLDKCVQSVHNSISIN
jgi:hypothetical protein